MTLKHTLSGDDRGQSVVIGFVIVFLIVILGVGMYANTQIPNQDMNKEFQHSEETRLQFSELNNKIDRAADGDQQRTTLQMGLQYGSVTPLGVHSAPTQGTFRTGQYQGFDSEFSILNAQGVSGTTNKFWNGNSDRSYRTRYISYTPDYNYYPQAPNLYIEHGVFYSDFREGGPNNNQVIESNQNIVSGNRIDMTALSGDIATSQTNPENIQLRPVSASTETITVEAPSTAEPVTIRIPSRLGVEKWRTILDDERQRNGGYITGINEAGQENGIYNIEITFETSQRYELKLSKVHVTTDSQQTQTPTVLPAYADWRGNSEITVRKGETEFLDVTSRDRFNNPIGDTDITAETRNTADECVGSYDSAETDCSANAGTDNVYQQPGERTTGGDGQTRFIYVAPDEDDNGTEQDFAGNFNLYLSDGQETADGTGDVTGPSVTILDASWTTKGNSGKYDVSVLIDASDSVGLDGGSINEVRLYDTNGNLRETQEISPTGNEWEETVEWNGLNYNPDGWTAEVIISNSNDVQGYDTQTVTEN